MTTSTEKVEEFDRSDFENLPCSNHWTCQKYDYAYNTGQRVCCDGYCVEDCGFDWVVLTVVLISTLAGILCCIAAFLLVYYSVRGYSQRRNRRRIAQLRDRVEHAQRQHYQERPPDIILEDTCYIQTCPEYLSSVRTANSMIVPSSTANAPSSPPPEYRTSGSDVPPPDYESRQTQNSHSNVGEDKTPTPTHNNQPSGRTDLP